MARSRSRERSKKDRDRDRERDRNRERDRERDRDRDRERDRDRKKKREKSRSRSRSPRSRSPRHRKDRRKSRSVSRSPSPVLTLGGSIKAKQTGTSLEKPVIFDPQELEGKSQEEIDMLKLMGFSTFDTTKGKHVDGSCNAFAVNIQQKRKYRQYMNRKGGFNRPLDPVA